MAFFDKKFGQKLLFRLFLHSTYQSPRNLKFAGALSPWRWQKRAAGRKQPFRALIYGVYFVSIGLERQANSTSYDTCILLDNWYDNWYSTLPTQFLPRRSTVGLPEVLFWSATLGWKSLPNPHQYTESVSDRLASPLRPTRRHHGGTHLRLIVRYTWGRNATRFVSMNTKAGQNNAGQPATTTPRRHPARHAAEIWLGRFW